MKRDLLQYCRSTCLVISFLSFIITESSALQNISFVDVGLGWSGNSINTVIFRSNAVTSFKEYQFVAYYNQEGYVVLAKRKLNSTEWETNITGYKGELKDAHNSISIAIDGNGILHLSWDQHDTPLRYTQSKEPFGLELTEELEMTGSQELAVTYPEFHNLPNGDLLFLYRDGKSGKGHTVLKHFNREHKQWNTIQNNLLDGQEERSAYWQTAIDDSGGIHMSWVWREDWNVATNHDLCYGVSTDGGLTWKKSTGETYQIPITLESSEIAYHIPQKSNLINQTSMTVDSRGNPYIASYWSKNNHTAQYKVLYMEANQWKLMDTDFHQKSFELIGGGTQRIPLSRPEIMVNDDRLYLLFRDEEQFNKITLATTSFGNLQWNLKHITKKSVGQWEPNYDINLWKNHKELHIFSQYVVQKDEEGIGNVDPELIQIIELKDI